MDFLDNQTIFDISTTIPLDFPSKFTKFSNAECLDLNL